MGLQPQQHRCDQSLSILRVDDQELSVLAVGQARTLSDPGLADQPHDLGQVR